MELGRFYVEVGDLCVGHDNAPGVLAGVEFTALGEAGFGSRIRDQFNNHRIADRRLGTPILADEG